MHGGRAAQVKRKARQRIEETADSAAKNLIKIAFNETESAETRLKATLQLLDRAGVNAKTSIDVEVSAKPWEQVMEGMVDRIEVTSRDHYLRSVGELPPAKTDDSRAATGCDNSSMLAGRETRHDDGIVDAEVVDDASAFAYDMSGHDDAANLAGVTPPPSNAVMTMEQAYEELARINAAAAARQRAASAGHARISRRTRRPQR